MMLDRLREDRGPWKRIRRSSSRKGREANKWENIQIQESLFLLVKNSEGKCCDNLASDNAFSCSDDALLDFSDLQDDDHLIQFDALEKSCNNPFVENSDLGDEGPCKIETLEAKIWKLKAKNKKHKKLLQILDERECVYKEDIIKLKIQLDKSRKIEEGMRKKYEEKEDQYQILEA